MQHWGCVVIVGRSHWHIVDGVPAHLDMPSGIWSFLTRSGHGPNTPSLCSNKQFERRGFSFNTHTVPYTHPSILFWSFIHARKHKHTHTHTHTHTLQRSHSFEKRGLYVPSTPTCTHKHTCSHVRTISVFAAWAVTASCGHVPACWLLMGNRHGNRCHVMSSRSPGSLPDLFLLTERRGEERRGEERRGEDERGGKMKGEDVG